MDGRWRRVLPLEIQNNWGEEVDIEIQKPPIRRGFYERMEGDMFSYGTYMLQGEIDPNFSPSEIWSLIQDSRV